MEMCQWELGDDSHCASFTALHHGHSENLSSSSPGKPEDFQETREVSNVQKLMENLINNAQADKVLNEKKALWPRKQTCRSWNMFFEINCPK